MLMVNICLTVFNITNNNHVSKLKGKVTPTPEIEIKLKSNLFHATGAHTTAIMVTDFWSRYFVQIKFSFSFSFKRRGFLVIINMNL